MRRCYFGPTLFMANIDERSERSGDPHMSLPLSWQCSLFDHATLRCSNPQICPTGADVRQFDTTTRGLPKRAISCVRKGLAALAFRCGCTRISSTFASTAHHNHCFTPLIGGTTLSRYHLSVAVERSRLHAVCQISAKSGNPFAHGSPADGYTAYSK